jgi:hypothetical protein
MKGLIERTEVYLATLQEEQRRLRKEEIGYSSANSESFGLVEESCPVLETILEKHLAEGRKVTHQMRALMLAELKEKITYPFRKALNQALEDKHRLLKLVRESRESSSEVLRNVIRSKSETTEEPVENIHEEEDE